MEIEEESKNDQISHLLSIETKWIIIHYKKLGFSNKETARVVGEACNRPTLSHQTVKSIWNKYHETGAVDNNWNEMGRPSLLGEMEIEQVISFFL